MCGMRLRGIRSSCGRSHVLLSFSLFVDDFKGRDVILYTRTCLFVCVY